MNSYHGASFNGIDQNGAGTSAINFRAQEDLGGGMKAYMRIENDISFMNNTANTGALPTYGSSTGVASGTAATINAKTAYGQTGTFANGELAVGAKGGFGDVSFGALNNAGLNYFLMTAVPTQGTSFGGGYGTILGTDPTMSSVRWANSTRYIAPQFIPGLDVSFIYAAKQSNNTPPVKANNIDALTNSYGVGLNNQVGAQELGLKYATGPLTLAYVNTKTSLSAFCAAGSVTATANWTTTANSPCVQGATAGILAAGSAVDTSQDNRQTSFAAGYDMGSLYLSGALQHTVLGAVGSANSLNQSDRQAMLLNVRYTNGVNTYFATYGTSKENAASSTNGLQSTMTAVGYNYAFSKQTSFVARYEHLNDNANILGTVIGAGQNPYGIVQGTQTGNNTRNRSMIGLNYNF